MGDLDKGSPMVVKDKKGAWCIYALYSYSMMDIEKLETRGMVS